MLLQKKLGNNIDYVEEGSWERLEQKGGFLTINKQDQKDQSVMVLWKELLAPLKVVFGWVSK